MLILALDSCGGAVSVACLEVPRLKGPGLDRSGGAAGSAGRIIGHALVRTETGQAAILAPQIRSVMRDAGLSFTALDRLAVTVGPGSFTGLRIGIAAARGLALATGKALYGITAFAAVAAATRAPAVLVALDSRRGDLFVQLFRDAEPASPPDLVAPASLRDWLLRQDVADPDTMTIAGDGAVAGIAASSLRGPAEDQPAPCIDASDVARLAARLPPERTLGTTPVYLRPPDAVPARPNGLPIWRAFP